MWVAKDLESKELGCSRHVSPRHGRTRRSPAHSVAILTPPRLLNDLPTVTIIRCCYFHFADKEVGEEDQQRPQLGRGCTR